MLKEYTFMCAHYSTCVPMISTIVVDLSVVLVVLGLFSIWCRFLFVCPCKYLLVSRCGHVKKVDV